MVKTIGCYTIKLFQENISNFSVIDSTWKCDLVYLDDIGGLYATTIGIKVSESDSVLHSAIIGAHGGGTGVNETSCVFEEDRIALCCSDTIFCLSIPDLNLLWKTKSDTATCFQIFRYKTDYIVHGELEITRLGNDGQIVWQQNGADIFTTLHSAKDDFIITDDYILVTDWRNRKYKFDFDGNSI